MAIASCDPDVLIRNSMRNFEALVPQHVRALGAYVPGKPIREAERESGVACIKMASNENPFGPSPRAQQAISQAAGDIYLYPDDTVMDLRVRLAAKHGLDPEQVLITAGSTAFLHIIGRTLLGPGTNAITSERSFIVYPIAVQATGAEFLTVPMRNDGFDLEAILRRIDKNTRVVFIANPNNPTGSLVDAREMQRFLDRVPEHVTVVLDEAYCDFAAYFAEKAGVEYSRSAQWVREGRNLIVLRTFSKAHGLAGVRIGYGFAPAGLMQFLARLRTVFSVSNVAEAAALAAMEDEGHVRKTLANNAEGAELLQREIAALGLRVLPTWANFLYVDVKEDAAAVAKRLQDEGVIIRPLSGGWGAPQAIRITVGTPEQNRRLLAAMKKVYAKAAV